MPVDPLAAIRLILAAVADGRVTVDEAAEIVEALLPRDVVLGLVHDLAELLQRDPSRMRERASELAAEGHVDRAMRLLSRAARVEARR